MVNQPSTSNAIRPNVVLIFLDDYGWKDTGCYGSSFYETPHLDQLAQQGMRFTNAYASCPVCSPSRASLLTGKYPARLGVTNWIHHGTFHPSYGVLIDAPYIKQLDTTEYSLARCLSDHGYQTWHVGKWHLGQEPYWPEKQGFDINIGGSWEGSPSHGYFSPYQLPNLPDGPKGEYLTDRLNDEAIALIQQRDPTRPFFLNYWPYAVHTPIQAKPDDIAYFQEKARRLGLDQTNPIQEGEYFPCEHKKHLRVQRRTIQSDPVYAAMIKNLDENLGKLFDTLQQAGLADQTMIIFSSDNGGLATAEGSPTCNAPLTEGKGWMYEGGTREPLIIKLPGITSPGSVCDQPTTTPDIYPTILQALGLPPEPQQHCDGQSIYPLLAGQTHFDRGPLFWHYPHYGNQGGTPGSSIRLGHHKLIHFFEDDHIELYDLQNDISETTNLAHQLPELAKDLYTQLAQWRQDIQARIPQANPQYTAWNRFDGLPPSARPHP